MKLESIKDLEALVKLCRKHGIEAIEVDNVKFSLGSAPKRVSILRSEDPLADARIPMFNGITNPNVAQVVADQIKTDELSPDQLLFYSSSDRLEDKAN